MTTISQNGGIIYIQQSGSNIQYQKLVTTGAWTTISSWPATFTNGTPSAGSILTVQLNTNITVSSTQGAANGYFKTGSNYITYDGSTSNYTVTISGLTNYNGFIQNGTSTIDGYHTVTVQNINLVSSASTLNTTTFGGWLCQNYFGKNSTTNLITVTNCSNSGTIGISNGGICGQYFGYNATATISNCYNIGTISNNSGGICGPYAGSSGGTITISNCYNTGAFSGTGGGGIVGQQSGLTNGRITISNCYNTGTITGTSIGGIAGQQFGYNTSQTCSILNCYNTSSIGSTGSAGICGLGAGANTSFTPVINITNCYNLGTISSTCSGILGGNSGTNTNIPTVTITNCYSAYPTNSGSAITSMVQSIPNKWPTPTQTNCYSTTQVSWSDTSAKAALTGFPTSLYVSNPGTTWITLALNTPYVLSSFNSQIYSPNTVTSSNLSYTSSAGLFSSSTYSLISVNSAATPSNVTIASATGALTITNSNYTTSSYVEQVFVYKGTYPNYYAYNFNTFSLTLQPFNISQNGGTVYIQQSGTDIQYQSNSTSGTWTTISSSNWPVTITNSNPVSGNILTVSLFSAITVSSTQTVNGYFITGSNYITYDGSTSNYTVTISGLTGYTGFIQNGTSITDGYHTVTVKNINSALASSSTLTTSGWICQNYFGKNIKSISGYNAATNLITVTNCSNSATVGSSNGGICGQYFGYNADATITNCFNTGSASAGSCGGIVADSLADSGGTVTISNCYNTGNVGANSGGICGTKGGSNNGTVTISNCYNTGNISGNGGGGGIAGQQFGYNTNQTCSISNCYNIGTINTTSTTTGPGGICGKGAGNNTAAISYTPVINISNCYNLGTISNGTGSPVIGCAGILGGNPITASTITPTITITNCYSVNPSSAPSDAITTMTTPVPTQTNCFSYTTWTDTSAKAALTGYPTSLYVSNPGTTWTSVATDSPYVLSSFNSQIYSPNTVTTSNLSYTSSAGLFSSSNYSLISVNNAAAPINVTIASSTGVLTVTNSNYSESSYVEQVFVSKGTLPNYYAYNFNTFSLTYNIISQNGGTVYIQQSGTNIQYQSNSTSGAWTTISSWPVIFKNSNPVSGNILTVQLNTNITVSSTQTVNGYFVTGSNYITYDGSSSNYTVTISGLTSYTGFIQNGTSTTDGYHTVTVQNIKSAFASSSTLLTSGWICQSYFGKNIKNAVGYNSATNLITVTNCSNSGIIGTNNGGICGQYFGYNADATITNCFNTGTSINDNSGGICGPFTGSNNGAITITKCYNTGTISGDGGGGGIAGLKFGTNTSQTCSISNCYNTGSITTNSNSSGGICGRGAGYNTAAISYTPTINTTNCYNLGTIGSLCSGILGGNGSSNTNIPTITITNCYSAYTSNSGSAITSMVQSIPNKWPNPSQTNCYSTLQSAWSDSSALSALTGTPTSVSLYSSNPGTTWTSVSTNTPYVLSAYNSEIYTPNVYSNPTLPTYTTIPGSFSSADGYTYSLVSANTNNGFINSNTGSLTFTNLTWSFSYTANVLASKGTAPSYTAYNISTYTLNNVYCFKEATKILCFTDKEEYIPIENLKPGVLVKTVSSGFKKIEAIGYARVYYDIKNNGRTKKNLYKLCKTEFPELFEDLVITGCHSILVKEFINEEQRNKTIEVNGNTYLTDSHYRLPACADNRIQIYDVDDVHVVWHFSLEHTDYFMNYGVYANGLLVETTSNRMMKELACLNPVNF